MKPFENPSNSANSAGMGITYKRAALLAGGIGAVAWYIAARRDTRKPPPPITDATLHPKHGETTMQVGTSRAQQQERDPPPSKKT